MLRSVLPRRLPEPVVLSVGGSMIVTSAGINYVFLRALRRWIVTASKKNQKFVLVCGGGTISRIYQAAGKKLRLSATAIDWIGIRATELNAELARQLFVGVKNVVVRGGEVPGQSSDAVAVREAVRVGARVLVNISNTDFVYDRDPQKYPRARALKNLAWPEFLQLVGKEWRPGMHTPFDPVAARRAARADLTVRFVSGHNLPACQQALAGGDFVGSTVS